MNLPFPQLISLLARMVPRLLTEQNPVNVALSLFFWMRRWQFVARKRCVLLLQPAERYYYRLPAMLAGLCLRGC